MNDDRTEPLAHIGLIAWSPDETRDYLDENPLPKDFTWTHRDGAVAPVQPAYAVKAYGKWLRETPYFQGLFEEIHRIILHAGAKLPDIDAIAAELLRRHPKRRFGAEESEPLF